tara:strand:- start:404 stop:589 length:186 start_codon:yes stop_codon:yes gene_type:complete
MEFIPYFELAVITAMAVMMFNMYSRVNVLEEAIDEVDEAIDEMDADLEEDFAYVENQVAAR